MNAIYEIIHTKGNASIKQICDYACISNRQLERLFQENIGISPKKFENLVRYQILWQDILKGKTYNVQEAVYKYGFSDQSHLINTFKNYHTMTPKAKHICMDTDFCDEKEKGRYGKTGYMYNIHSPRNPETGEVLPDCLGAIEQYN